MTAPHFVTGLAAALVAHTPVDAALLAAAVVHGALVHAALALRLVLPIAAIVASVAEGRGVEAAPTVAEAVELRRIASL